MPEPEDHAIVFLARPATNILSVLFFLGLLVLLSSVLWSASDWGHFKYFAMILCLPLLTFYIPWTVRNACRGRKAMLAIGTHGLFDWRISNSWIPWSAINRLEKRALITKGFQVGVAFVMRLDPDFASTFAEKPLYRAYRFINSWTWVDAFVIGLTGTEARCGRIAEALDRHFPQWRRTQT
jgi:hypothetical protein